MRLLIWSKNIVTDRPDTKAHPYYCPFSLCKMSSSFDVIGGWFLASCVICIVVQPVLSVPLWDGHWWEWLAVFGVPEWVLMDKPYGCTCWVVPLPPFPINHIVWITMACFNIPYFTHLLFFYNFIVIITCQFTWGACWKGLVEGLVIFQMSYVFSPNWVLEGSNVLSAKIN